jgi:hypothetical protein
VSSEEKENVGAIYIDIVNAFDCSITNKYATHKEIKICFPQFKLLIIQLMADLFSEFIQSSINSFFVHFCYEKLEKNFDGECDNPVVTSSNLSLDAVRFVNLRSSYNSIY